MTYSHFKTSAEGRASAMESDKAAGRRDGSRPAGSPADGVDGMGEATSANARPEKAGGAHAGDSARDRGEQSWRNLLALDADLFEQRGIRLLTPEARVLINLKLTGSVPVTTAMKLAGTSYRGFYAVLERLKQAGLIDQAKDLNDQRVRNLRLDPSVPLPPDQI